MLSMAAADITKKVRASNLLDLIYKRGQAGVTRASVTIVFDNADKTNAPVGFEHLAEISVTRQIFLNGTSKYLICGHRSTQSAVQNLFQSVGLNINNPNFLIMQGHSLSVVVHPFLMTDTGQIQKARSQRCST